MCVLVCVCAPELTRDGAVVLGEGGHDLGVVAEEGGRHEGALQVLPNEL